jgi:hypothetical protein
MRDSSGILLCSPDDNRDYIKDTANSLTRKCKEERRSILAGHAQKIKTLAAEKSVKQGFKFIITNR